MFVVYVVENGEGIDGEEYPIDIWHVIAAYIRPEDVCRFALICKNAWAVTCTAAFWTRLYKRYGILCTMILSKAVCMHSTIYCEIVI